MEDASPPGKNQELESVRYRTVSANCSPLSISIGASELERQVKQEKRDRRSQRTRQLIRSALLDLVFERQYDEIIVQDILDRANIGRSTFYAHYFDKDDVLANIAEEQLTLLSQQLTQREAGQGVIPSLEVLRHVQQHQRYFRAMLRCRGRKALWDSAQTALSRAIEQALMARRPDTQTMPVPVSIISQYLAGAFLSLLEWWLETETPYSPEQMDEMFRQLALPGVWATMEAHSATTAKAAI
jgi:AcrR family transcriptional regulator